MDFETYLSETSNHFTTKDLSTWKENAERRGLQVRKAIHPSGEAHDYFTAKDRQGNWKGHFDSSTKSGELK